MFFCKKTYFYFIVYWYEGARSPGSGVADGCEPFQGLLWYMARSCLRQTNQVLLESWTWLNSYPESQYPGKCDKFREHKLEFLRDINKNCGTEEGGMHLFVCNSK